MRCSQHETWPAWPESRDYTCIISHIMRNGTIAEAIYGTQAGPSSSVYAHPYYESDRKGKGTQIDAQLDRIKEVKQSIALAQASLSRREGDWGKLARSLREM